MLNNYFILVVVLLILRLADSELMLKKEARYPDQISLNICACMCPSFVYKHTDGCYLCSLLRRLVYMVIVRVVESLSNIQGFIFSKSDYSAECN